MEGRRENIETFPSPFSSDVSPPRDVDGLAQSCRLSGLCYVAKMDGPHEFTGIGVTSVFLHVTFCNVFESFSLSTTCSHTILYFPGRHCNTVVSPAELIPHYISSTLVVLSSVRILVLTRRSSHRI